MSKQKKIVVIGGGTGTSVVLSALSKQKKYDLTAVVAVSDSGGSTGRLRDEFGFLPVGDVRQCLAALAHGSLQKEIRKMLLYRFSKGSGLKGHNLGNLILTALEDLSDSPGKAIEIAAQIFNIEGKVFPITEQEIELVTEYDDGTVKIGEHLLDNPKFGGRKINQIKISPHAKIYKKAEKAIKEANLIILGPGDLYASLLPNTLVAGFKQALQQSKAKFLYIVNLVTHYSQTHKMTAVDHVAEVSKYCGRKPDIVLVNKEKLPRTISEQYAKQHEFVVVNDLDKNSSFEIIEEKLVAEVKQKQHPADEVPRSLLRHDGDRVGEVVGKILE